MADMKKIKINGVVYNVNDPTKLAINQGTANSGKFLVVGSSGNIELQSISSANGQSF